MHRHVLVVMPHPDDETFACGGTIAMYTQAGTPVTYLCGTKGEMGRNMGKPAFANRESLPALREKELRDACDALGVTDLRFMGIRDKTTEFLDPEWLADQVAKVIDELKPSLVITYHPQYSVHPDHMALGAATVRAVERMDPAQRSPVHCRAFGTRVEELGEPDLVVDAAPVLAIKMAAIKAHRSQSENMLKKAESDPAERARIEEMRSKEPYWIWKF